jgi:hypothetical protein
VHPKCPGGTVRRAGRATEEGVDGGQDGHRDVHQPGVRGAELPSGRGHGGAAGPRPHRGRRPRRARDLPVGAPPLLPPPAGRRLRRRLQRREVLHDRGLPRDDVGQEPVPADHPELGFNLLFTVRPSPWPRKDERAIQRCN